MKSNVNRLKWNFNDNNSDSNNIQRSSRSAKILKNKDINSSGNVHVSDSNSIVDVQIDDCEEDLDIIVALSPQQIRTFKMVFQK